MKDIWLRYSVEGHSMDNHERVHRPDPERIEPKRDSAPYFFSAVTGGGPKSKPQPKNSAEKSDDAVAHGVRLGYHVVEEQIREGQRLAQRLRQAADLKGVTESEGLGPLAGRVLNLYKDLGALCIDAVEALARSPALRLGLSRVLQSEQGPDSGPDEVCAVEVSSSRRTQVMLKLPRVSRTLLPHVHALHAPDPAIPPLTNVRFSMEPATGVAMLHVDIPDWQSPATYTGVVVDRTTNEPCGTLCIRLIP
jgi:hypothetical protein